jgi:sodium/proline symporter
MSTILVSFALYTLAIMVVGVYSARYAKRTSSDFLLASRGLGAWVAGLSSAASAESGWVTLGLVGISFKTGIGALWIVPGTVLAFLFNWVVIANRLRRTSLERGALTIPDVLALPYEGIAAVFIRVSAVLIILSMLTAYVAAQLNATGKTFEATFGWSYSVGVLGGASIVLIYTVTGGFRAVSWTDVVQAMLIVGAVLLLPIVLLVHAGGIFDVWARLQTIEAGSNFTQPFAGKTGMALIGFLAVWLGIPLGYPGQPHVLIRFMAIQNEAAVRRGAVISTVWVFLVFCGAVGLGIVARAVYGELPDPEKVLPIAAMDFLPGVLAGLVIAAVLAAICSTADSQLLLSASAVTHDLYVRLFGREPDESHRFRANRLVVLLIGVIATLVAAAEVRTVFDFVLYAWAGLGAAFGPALILTLVWHRTTGWGVLSGILVGFVTAIVWRQTLHYQLYELLPAFAFAFAAVVLVSLLTGAHASRRTSISGRRATSPEKQG